MTIQDRNPTGVGPKESCETCPVAGRQFYVLAGAAIHERVEACRIATRYARRRERIVTPREDGDRVHVLRSGWACSYSQFPDGRRQIFELFLAGDVIDPDPLPESGLQPEVCALTPVQLCIFNRPAVTERVCECAILRLEAWRMLARRHRRALRRILAAAAMNAEEAVAALVLQLARRQGIPPRAGAAVIDFPLRLVDIADSLGMTDVHAGRVMRTLASRGILSRKPGGVLSVDMAALEAAAGPGRAAVGGGSSGSGGLDYPG